jgi:hypothetical protein
VLLIHMPTMYAPYSYEYTHILFSKHNTEMCVYIHAGRSRDAEAHILSHTLNTRKMHLNVSHGTYTKNIANLKHIR